MFVFKRMGIATSLIALQDPRLNLMKSRRGGRQGEKPRDRETKRKKGERLSERGGGAVATRDVLVWSRTCR